MKNSSARTPDLSSNAVPGTPGALLLVCLVGAVCVGSFWGSVDLIQALIKVGGGSYPQSTGLILTLYVAVAACMALALVCGGLVRRWSVRKGMAVTTAVGFAGFGLAVSGMFGNLYWFPGSRTVTGLAINVGLLIIWVGVGYLLLRVMSRVGKLRGLLSWGGLSLSLLGCLGLVIYSAWAGNAPPSRVVPAPTGVTQERLPSFLVLVVDSLRAQQLSMYGYGKQTTPHLEAMARQGVLFSQAYAQTSWTLPSVSTILTSLYPSSHGATKRWDKLPEEIQTLPELLKPQGYVTAAFSSNPFISQTFGLDQGFDYLYQPLVHERYAFLPFVVGFKLFDIVERRLLPFLQQPKRLLLTLFGFEAEKWENCDRDNMLNQALKAWLDVNHTQPFFVYVHYMCPHYPYFPPGEQKLEWQMKVILNDLKVSEDKRQALLQAYDHTIQHSDRLIGEIDRHLQRLALHERTFVVVTADHGQEFYEHRGWTHGKTLYNEVIKVPLLVRFPSLLRPRRTVDTPVMLIDLLPTIVALAGAKAPPSIQGENMLTRMHAKADERWTYAELIGRNSDAKEGNVFRVLIRGNRKYIKTVQRTQADPQFELYDLRQDAAEQTNLWSLQSAESRRQWDTALAKFAAPRQGFAKQRAVISEQTEKRLRALGYIQ